MIFRTALAAFSARFTPTPWAQGLEHSSASTLSVFWASSEPQGKPRGIACAYSASFYPQEAATGGAGQERCWEGIPSLSLHPSKRDRQEWLHLLLTLSRCHGNTCSHLGKNGYFCLFVQGGGSTLVFQAGEEQGSKQDSQRWIMDRITQTGHSVLQQGKVYRHHTCRRAAALSHSTSAPHGWAMCPWGQRYSLQSTLRACTKADRRLELHRTKEGLSTNQAVWHSGCSAVFPPQGRARISELRLSETSQEGFCLLQVLRHIGLQTTLPLLNHNRPFGRVWSFKRQQLS